jgi:hypothetical protein
LGVRVVGQQALPQGMEPVKQMWSGVAVVFSENTWRTKRRMEIITEMCIFEQRILTMKGNEVR